MPIKLILFLTVLTSLLLNADNASSHPGRTDSSGGHTCRTNCERWGLEYGEYHYHNGSSSRPRSYTPPSTPQTPTYSAPNTPSKTTPSSTGSATPSKSSNEETDYGWIVILGIIGAVWWSISVLFGRKSTTAYRSKPAMTQARYGICPRCGGNLRLINGKRGKFYGCSNFITRNCRYTKSL